MTRTTIAAAAAAGLSALLGGQAAHAHAIASPRIFPVTPTIDDIGDANEASLPTFSYQRLPNDPGTGHGLQYNITGEFNPVGVVTQVHLFFDDLFPTSLGKPLFQ